MKLAAKYAALFRVHFWDDYVDRQYQRLRSVVRNGDTFIVFNKTSGSVPIPRPNTIFHTQEDVIALGLSEAGPEPLLWFNGDYPLYFFYERYPDYDYYIMSEYDVVVQRDLDEIVSQLARENIDFVGRAKGPAVVHWPFTDTCLDIYSKQEIRHRLICIAMFSNRAVRHLFHRRLELSKEQRETPLRRWPYCEAFVPTELERAGFAMEDLSRFGPTAYYDWRPSILESDLPVLAEQGFIHPVLDTTRYVDHRTKNLSGVLGLRRVPLRLYAQPLARALWRRARADWRRAGSDVRKLLRVSARHE